LNKTGNLIYVSITKLKKLKNENDLDKKVVEDFKNLPVSSILKINTKK